MLSKQRVSKNSRNGLVFLVVIALSLALASELLAIFRASVQNLEVVSLGSGSVPGDKSSFFIYTSEDARYVAFESFVQNWTGEAPVGDNWTDIFYRDRLTDVTKKVTYSYQGGEADESSYDPVLTADGRYVAFISYATNLVPNDTNSSEWSRDGLDVFIYDSQTETNERVSLKANGQQIKGNSVGTISPDGKYVLFLTNGQIFPHEPMGPDQSALFLRDWHTGEIERVSRAVDGGLPNATPGGGSISFDNRYIVYNSEATNLVPGDTNGLMDVFVYDRLMGTTERINLTPAGGQANGRSSQAQISYDGRFVVFLSSANNLVSNDTNGEADIFVYERATKTTRRENVAENGAQANGFSRDPSICGNGRFVSYTTEATNLVPGDNNNQRDVIVRDLYKGTNAVATMNADGQFGNAKAHRSYMAPDCRSVAFSSDSSNLVANDTNNERDLFLGSITLPADFEDSSVQNPVISQPGEIITYTFTLRNSGYESGIVLLQSQVPTNTVYVANSATGGAIFDPGENSVTWTGDVAGLAEITIAYAVQVDGALVDPTLIICQSSLTGSGQVYPLVSYTMVNGTPVFLPVVSGSS